MMGTEAGDATNHPILQRTVLTTKPNICIVLKFTNSMLNEESEAQGSRPSYTTIGDMWGQYLTFSAIQLFHLQHRSHLLRVVHKIK